VATGAGRIGCSITGQPGHPIENVLLSNLAFEYEGGGKRDRSAAEVPELPKAYPESTMFGELPAYGFYARHVKGLRFTNVRLRTTSPDLRHALVLDDTEDVAIAQLDADYSAGAAPALKLVQTRNALISGCQSRAKGGTFLQVAGASTAAVALVGNDLTVAAKATLIGREVPRKAISMR
jgi:hypothetical protein